MEATTEKSPEVLKPRRVGRRPPTQYRRSLPIDAEQEPSGDRRSSRESAPEREHPATGASKEELGSEKSKNAREEDVDRCQRGMKQLPDRQEATEDRPPEGSEPRQVVQRSPNPGCGGPALDVEQEPPEARKAKDRS